MNRFYIIGLVFISFLLSCKKRENTEPPTVTYAPSSIYIVNNLPEPIHINMYKSLDDYNNSTNAVFTAALDTGKAYNWQVDISQGRYYMDWYSDDYSISNWAVYEVGMTLDGTGSGNHYDYLVAIRGPELTKALINDSLYLDMEARTGATGYTYYANFSLRSNLVNGNAPQTTWHGADAYNAAGVSQWPKFSAQQKQMTFTLQKDGHYALSCFDQQNRPQATAGIYTLDFSASYYHKPDAAKLNLTDTLSSRIGGQSLLVTPPFRGPYQRDTICYYDENYYYVLVRDK